MEASRNQLSENRSSKADDRGMAITPNITDTLNALESPQLPTRYPQPANLSRFGPSNAFKSSNGIATTSAESAVLSVVETPKPCRNNVRPAERPQSAHGLKGDIRNFFKKTKWALERARRRLRGSGDGGASDTGNRLSRDSPSGDRAHDEPAGARRRKQWTPWYDNLDQSTNTMDVKKYMRH